MKIMTEEEYQRKLQKAKDIGKTIEYKLEIAEAKNKSKKKRETSKLLALYLFALLNIIVIYAMIAMWKFSDISYLGVLITDIASQILIYGIYCLKAYKGKKSEEDMKFEREKIELGICSQDDPDGDATG